MAKSFSVEVDFTPFNQTAPIAMNSFKGRYFIDSKKAVRIGFNFKNKTNSYEKPAFTDSEFQLSDKVSEKYTVFGISSGFEFHFLESSRVSPYCGFDIFYENKISNAIYKEYIRYYDGSATHYVLNNTDYKNSWRPSSPYTLSINDIRERGYSSLGANVILGADYFIVEHLYLGLELGFGYNSLKHKEIVIEFESTDDVINYPELKTSEFGLNINNAIRLGFWF